jgi:hypothetical protein
VGGLLVSCASTHAATQVGHQGPARTVVDTFDAFSPSGGLVVRISGTTSGNCWTASIAVDVAGAYRCFAGNQILDPCFAPAGQAAPLQLACVASPWAPAIQLTLTSPLPTGGQRSGDPIRPWALELANGARCVSSTGTVPAVQGVNLEYYCSPQHSAGLLDATSPLATADYGDLASGTLQQTSVTTLWRG